jgi:hypothetical protein
MQGGAATRGSLAIAVTYLPGGKGVVLNQDDEGATAMNMSKPEWNDLLTHLPDKERQVVLERFFHGKTVETVGKILGVSAERARQILKNALHRLKKLIEDKAEHPRKRISLAEGWFVDVSKAGGTAKYAAFAKRMKRQIGAQKLIRVTPDPTWPGAITYWGPVKIVIGRKTIKGIAQIEAKGTHL